MKLVHIKNPNFEVMKKIVEIEQEAFEGAGNVDLWIVKALIRYGMVFVIEEDNKIVCIVEYMQIFNKKSLFLYGISTLKKYRHKGYANYILNETTATSYNVEQAFWSLRNIIGCQVVDIYQKEQSYRCISRKIKLFLLQKFRKLLDI